MKFKLPIEYLNNKELTSKTIITDLELDQTNSCFYKIFDDSSNINKLTIPLWYKYYTNDVLYLKQTQILINKIITLSPNSINLDEFYSNYYKTLNITNFKDEYFFINYEKFEILNTSSTFLQIMAIYLVLSPLLSLISPFLILLIPFFIIRVKGHILSLQKYISVLKNIIKHFPIGQLFNFNNLNLDKKLYSLVSFSFYLFQMYQNSMSCYNFYKKTNIMHETIMEHKIYAQNVISHINNYLSISSYSNFNSDLKIIQQNFYNFLNEFKKISSVINKQISKIYQTGTIMKLFYKLFNDQSYKDTLLYSFNYYSYIKNLRTANFVINNKLINNCKYTKKNMCKFKNAYYGDIKSSTIIENSYKLQNNFIISGPNASGKTTIIKTTLLNILLSQQIGAGFYTSAKINPYKYLHCYINIPDTSNRDSLFQAEVRRCKYILDTINDNIKYRHFCIFDELFSGTNPYEAVSAGYAYIKFLNKHSNINFMLTTHYFDLCNDFKEINYCMKNNYKLHSGISEIKGGINILKELNYPETIIKNAYYRLDLYNS